MKNMSLGFVALAFLAVPISAKSGSWNVGGNEGLIIAEVSSFRANSGIDDGEKVSFQAPWADHGFQIYGEYGVTNRIMLTAKFRQQYAERSFGQLTSKVRLSGPHSIGVQYQLRRKDQSATAIRFEYEGLGEGSNLAHLLTGPDTKPAPLMALTHGQNVKFRGRSGYFDLSLHHRFGGNSYSEAQMVFGYDAGSAIKPMIKLRMGQTNSSGPSKASWTELDISAQRPISNSINIQLGHRQTLSGNNIAQFKGLYIGLWHRF
jgi:hypothetical protein